MFTLRRLLTNVEDKDRPGAVSKIKCSNYQATYIGETGRNLTRLNEHKRAARKGDLNNNIAEHLLKASHTIDRDSVLATVPTTIYQQTALTRHQPLPAAYKRLLNRKQ